ncbi:MAG: hypothetical protein ABSE46_14000 [Terracidiphilus sp.]|jgi:hypothetical protein
MITAAIEKQAANTRLSRKVAVMTDAQRFERLQVIADDPDSTSDENVLEFIKLLWGPGATLSDERWTW